MRAAGLKTLQCRARGLTFRGAGWGCVEGAGRGRVCLRCQDQRRKACAGMRSAERARSRPPTRCSSPPLPGMFAADTGGLVKDSWHEFEWQKLAFLRRRFGGGLRAGALRACTCRLEAVASSSLTMGHNAGITYTRQHTHAIGPSKHTLRTRRPEALVPGVTCCQCAALAAGHRPPAATVQGAVSGCRPPAHELARAAVSGVHSPACGASRRAGDPW